MLLSKLFQENNSTPFKGRDVVLSTTPTKPPLNPFSLYSSSSSPFDQIIKPQTQLLQGSGAQKTMKFKKGNAVEVLRRNEKCETWFPGTILSADVYKCIVRYDRFLNREGDPVVEEVCNENVRPYPPPVKGGERWVVGDKVEVFDLHCWKVGKIVKVLNNDRFVIRLSGSIQLKEFQRFDLRVRHAWQNNTWVQIEKVGEQIIDNVKLNTSKFTKGWGCMPPEHGILKEAATGEDGGQKFFETFSPVRNLKRKNECNFKLLPEDVAMGVVKEKKTSTKAGRFHMLPTGTSPLLRQVDVISSPRKKMGKKCMIRSTMDVQTKKTNNLHPYSMPVSATEESNECSVASCSNNGPLEYTSQQFRRSRNITARSFNDAESVCPSESESKSLPSYDEVQIEADVHNLELHAYRLTMHALYASGPLSWEQESLLTNLRLSLHISNEEHLLHLRQLLSAQVL